MKIIINGETLDTGFDLGRVPMATALEIEKAASRRYVEWESELLGGAAEATCVLIWLTWQRDGRDVGLQDILTGEVSVNFSETYRSFLDAFAELAAAAKAAQENPTSGAAPLTAPDGTPTTPAATKPSSPKSST